jgi:hypothetical protein
MAKASDKGQLVVCVKNEGYEVSLELRKIYVAIEDEEAKAHRMVRVIDESGDDYLYPQKLFLSISLPEPVRRAVLTAA